MSEVIDNFETGVFWEIYKDLERQFENFLEYVPYLEGNVNTYSFRLLNLILSIGGYIDSAFKDMAKYPSFSNNEACKKILEKLEESQRSIQSGKAPKPISIKLCLEAFEKEYKLSQKYVVFKRIPVVHVIIPFESWSSKRIPEWWNTYNGLKHDVSSNIEKANLLNTVNALAGAFLLNAIHIPAAIRMYKYGIIKPGVRQAFRGIVMGPAPKFYPVPEKKLKDFYERHGHFLGIVETSLFVYNHEAIGRNEHEQTKQKLLE